AYRHSSGRPRESGKTWLLPRRVTLDSPAQCSLIVRVSAIGDRRGHLQHALPVAGRDRADRAHYRKLLEKWGSDEAIDDAEHAFGSLFWQMPERVPCVTLDAKTGLEALEEAAMRWQRHPRLDGRVGYLIFDRSFTDCVIEISTSGRSRPA